MNTFLIDNDNTIKHTVKSPIIEKSNLVDSFQVVCPRFYNDYDMAEFNLLMEYKLPSGVPKVVELVLSDKEYKKDYLLYTLPSGTLTTAITSEEGEVKIAFTFVKVGMGYDGKTREFSREIASSATLKILPLTSWFQTSNEELSDLAALYLENKKSILALNEVVSRMEALNSESSDDADSGDDTVIKI